MTKEKICSAFLTVALLLLQVVTQEALASPKQNFKNDLQRSPRAQRAADQQVQQQQQPQQQHQEAQLQPQIAQYLDNGPFQAAFGGHQASYSDQEQLDEAASALEVEGAQQIQRLQVAQNEQDQHSPIDQPPREEKSSESTTGSGAKVTNIQQNQKRQHQEAPFQMRLRPRDQAEEFLTDGDEDGDEEEIEAQSGAKLISFDHLNERITPQQKPNQVEQAVRFDEKEQASERTVEQAKQQSKLEPLSPVPKAFTPIVDQKWTPSGSGAASLGLQPMQEDSTQSKWHNWQRTVESSPKQVTKISPIEPEQSKLEIAGTPLIQTNANKLASLVTGREGSSAYTRANAAIEYLKNILKSKNGTATDANGLNSFRLSGESAKLQRLESIAARLESLLQKGENTSESSTSGSDQEKELKAVPLQPLQLGETKFSIKDAKSVPVVSASEISPASEKLENDPNNPRNGTPLGGDYIESSDEYPRSFPKLKDRRASSESQAQTLAALEQVKPDETSKLEAEASQHSARNPVSESLLPSESLLSGSKSAKISAYSNSSESAVKKPQIAHSSKFFRFEQPPKHFVSDEQGVKQQALGQQLELSNQQKLADLSQASGGADFGQLPVLFSHHIQHIQSYQEPTSVQQPTLVQSLPKIIINKPVHQPTVVPQVQEVIDQVAVNQPFELKQPQQQDQQSLNRATSPVQQAQSVHQQQQKETKLPTLREPKIIQYDRPVEGPSKDHSIHLQNQQQEAGTSYQLADALFSSTGSLEQLLSRHELESIKNQFMTAEKSVLGQQAEAEAVQSSDGSLNEPLSFQQDQQASLSQLLSYLGKQQQHQQEQVELAHVPTSFHPKQQAPRPTQVQPQAPHLQQQQLQIPTQRKQQQEAQVVHQVQQYQPKHSIKQAGDKKANPTAGAERPDELATSGTSLSQKLAEVVNESKPVSSSEAKKKKSLIVYLNHPRASDISLSRAEQEEINAGRAGIDPNSDPFISAKEFDGLALSKESKQLDISNLKGAQSKEDKDGVSVVVIGDAYKYKKIVLLISSKSGGLKFLPVVKDMER